LFGATDKLDEVAARIDELPPIVVLRLRNMNAIDATGLQALELFADLVHKSNRGLILCGAPEQPAQFMQQAEFEEHVGRENICANIAEALERARQLNLELGAEAPSAPPWGRRATDFDVQGVAAKP